jgi:fructokinase
MNPIVGIGELLWDVYPDDRRVAGGAPFNFAFHCHQLGHPAAIVSRVGDDELGRELRDEVRRLGLSDEYIQTDRDHPTGTVRVTLDAKKVPTYTITENVAWDYIAWDERLETLAGEAGAVCFGTLAQRADQSRTTIQQFIGSGSARAVQTVPAESPQSAGRELIRRHGDEEANRRPLRVFDVNLRQNYFAPKVVQWCSFLSDWVKLNSDESRALHDVFKRAVGEYEVFLRKLLPIEYERQRCLIVTDGSEGCLVLAHNQEFTEPGVPARVVDTVGAGDAFTAAMVCLHLEGRPLRECARFANHSAARVCVHQGATPRINRDEVERAAGLTPSG